MRRLAEWEGRSVDEWRAAWGVPALHVFERVASTSDVMRAEAVHGAAAGTTAIADLQTAGRGQHGRTWTSNSGQSLLMSVLLRPARAEAPGVAPLRAGLAAAEAIEAVCDTTVGLKWPNDLLIDGRKVGGVLCEATTTGSAITIVVGVGINVLQAETDFTPDVAPTATSLAIACGTRIERAVLAGALVGRLLARSDRIATAFDDAEQAAFATRDTLMGWPVEVDGVPAGTADGVTGRGELRVRAGARTATLHTGRVRIAGTRADAHERAR